MLQHSVFSFVQVFINPAQIKKTDDSKFMFPFGISLYLSYPGNKSELTFQAKGVKISPEYGSEGTEEINLASNVLWLLSHCNASCVS